ncbi:LuxR family transcriptional regulator [Mycobacterium sp. IS-1742]|uniref:response regulator transcription factor n=1 Tax=Mycobacterium sp. IS-1742 TaxID=1772285 RepID=UPI00074055E3|nr:response regulator transcription factor [Mycobacterium sp. IS-1742]KUI25664.1 LuxR family transcriptional regulator [Mycobacterium sp. IS-1742]
MSVDEACNSSISIVIVDGQDVVHAGIASWLAGSRPPIKIVGNYSAPKAFIKEHPKASPTVDVVLSALQFGAGAPDFDAIRQMSRVGHCVIVYSYLATDEAILRCLDAGAISFVVKYEDGMHLCQAIYSARSNQPHIPPRMAEALLRDKTVGRPRLSQREIEVLQQWCRTENKEEVARRLFIESATVRTHLQRIRSKYAAAGRPASTKAALVVRAIQDGFLSTDEI